MARLQFGDFVLDVRTGELRKLGVSVRLQQQPAKVLALLAQRAGELVAREEIRAAVWGDDTFVNFDQGLNFCIKEIRAALQDPAAEPRFVETLPRRGYRFIAAVESLESDAPTPVEAPATVISPPTLARSAWRPSGWAGAAAAAVATAMVLLWQAPTPPPTPSPRAMLAVLPFENLSRDPQQDFFSDGLTEELIAQIGKLRPERLGVIACTQAMQYKGRSKGIGEIGRELSVDYVVEGSVRRGADRVRITVNLIKVADRAQVFSEAYERDDDDPLTIQREVALAVARRVETTLRPRISATRS